MIRPLARLSALALAVALSPAASALSFYAPVTVMPTMYDEFNYRRFVAAQVADLDGDGRVDVLLSEQEPGVILRQFRVDDDGKLSFVRDDAIPGFGSVYSAHVIATGDVDGDGVLEVLLSDPMGRWVAVLTRAADGTYAEQARLAFPLADLEGYAPTILVQDLSRDGTPDILVHIAHNVLLFRGLGAMAFAEPTLMQSYGNGHSLLRDLDGDGRAELLASGGVNSPGFGIAWGERGPHRMRAMDFVPVEPSAASVMGAGDLDGDGRQEAIVAHSIVEEIGNTIYHHLALTSFAGLPGQVLDAPVTRRIGQEGAPNGPDLVIADIDRDGDDDAIARFNGRIDVMTFEDGVMTNWRPAFVAHAANGVPPRRHVFVADLTGDGCPDIAELGAYAFAVHATRGGCGTAPASAIPMPKRKRPPRIGVETGVSPSPTTARSRRSSF